MLFKHAFKSVCTFWKSRKEDIKTTKISFLRQKRTDLSQQRVLLTNSLITANSRRSSGDLSSKSEIVDLEVSIRALIASESEGAKIRSCAKCAHTLQESDSQGIYNELCTRKVSSCK